MNRPLHRRLADRLASLSLACAVTFGLAVGLNALAAKEAQEAATTAAQVAAGVPVCARV